MSDPTRKRWAVRRELRFAVIVLLLGLATSTAVAWWAALWPLTEHQAEQWEEATGWLLESTQAPPSWPARFELRFIAGGLNQTARGRGDLPSWAIIHERLGPGVSDASETATGWPLPCLHRTHVDRRHGGVGEWDAECRGALLGTSPVKPDQAADIHLPVAPLVGPLLGATVFWALAWSALLLAPRLVRRLIARRRRRRGRCGRCGYPVPSGEHPCAECGTDAPYAPPIVSVITVRAGVVGVVVLALAMVGWGWVFTRQPPYAQLHRCAYQGDVPRIAALVAGGADVNAIDARFAGTPLDAAAQGADPAVIEALLGLAADPKQGHPVLHAVMGGRADNLAALIAAGADVDVHVGVPPLHVAVEKNSPKLCRQLLDAGADVTVINKRNWSALDEALMFGSPELVNLLLDHDVPATVFARSMVRAWIARRRPDEATIERLRARGLLGPP